jgi:hypothetical protein
MNIRRRAALGVALLVAASDASAFRFVEDFPWSGEHAFFVGGGEAVWWNANAWEVRNGTQYEEIESNTPLLPYTGKFAAVMKARTARRTDGRVSNTVPTPGGDGSAGAGVMHIDFQGIASARLRNPMRIPQTATGAATVTFYAPKFVTTGHWWEVAITPTQQTTAADFTAVPGRQDPESLNDPGLGLECPGNDGGCTNGPGNRSFTADSINVISTGYPDAPACDGSGWHARYAVTKAIGGQVTDFVTPRGSIEALTVVDPQDNVARELYPWAIVFTKDGITLKSDFDEDGVLEVIDHWNVAIPWREVYVNLLYVAYQSDHHPQAGCGFDTFGIKQAQEMEWRHVTVSPVRYARTWSLPESTAERHAQGFLSYDLRDVDAHVGSPVNGLPQPNAAPFDTFGTYLACWNFDPNGGIFCGDSARAHQVVTLHVDVGPQHLAGLAAAKLIADVRYTGRVRASINGTLVPALVGGPIDLPPDDSGFGFEPDVWIERSSNVPASLLHQGDNVIRLVMVPEPGYYSAEGGHGFQAQPLLNIDRIHLELYNTQ